MISFEGLLEDYEGEVRSYANIYEKGGQVMSTSSEEKKQIPKDRQIRFGTVPMMKIAWKLFTKGRSWYKEASQDGVIDSDEMLTLFKFLADSIKETFNYEIAINVGDEQDETPVEEIAQKTPTDTPLKTIKVNDDSKLVGLDDFSSSVM